MSITGPHPASRRDLLTDGVTDSSLRSLGGRSWDRIRRGSYLPSGIDLTGEVRCLALIRATAPLLADRSVLSHESAVLWRGLPLVGVLPSRVHVLRRDRSGGFRRGQLHCHVGTVDDDEIEVVDGVPVTCVARTVVDCARTLPLEAGLVLADLALRDGQTTRDELAEQLVRAARRTGIGRARWVVAFADERSESPGESISRLRIHQFGLPAPRLQYEIRLPSERRAFTDFYWEESRTAGEFDGKVKYGRDLRPGESAGDAVHREKVREDEIRDTSREVVRWGWAAFEDFTPVARSLRRAFERGRSR